MMARYPPFAARWSLAGAAAACCQGRVVWLFGVVGLLVWVLDVVICGACVWSRTQATSSSKPVASGTTSRHVCLCGRMCDAPTISAARTTMRPQNLDSTHFLAWRLCSRSQLPSKRCSASSRCVQRKAAHCICCLMACGMSAPRTVPQNHSAENTTACFCRFFFKNIAVRYCASRMTGQPGRKGRAEGVPRVAQPAQPLI